MHFIDNSSTSFLHNMDSNQNFATNYEEDQWPSFLKNFCTVTDQGEQSRANSDPCQSSVGRTTSIAESVVSEKTGGQGGFTCCSNVL